MSSSAITGPVLSDVRRAPSGTAAAPSFAFNDSTGTGVYLVSAGVLGLSTNGAQRVVVDASGNVGIGTGSPGGRIELQALAGNSSNVVIRLRATDSTGSAGSVADITAIGTGAQASALSFATRDGTNVVERMRLDASGNLLVGTNAVSSTLVHNIYGFRADGNDSGGCQFHNTNTTADANGLASPVLRINKYVNSSATSNNFIMFTVNSTNIGCGRISANGSGAAAFQTYSDERLKTNIKPLEKELSKILALNPVEFDYVENEQAKVAAGHQIGFIAQEIQNVYPDSVSEDSTGYLSVAGWDKTTARLVKAIQEQQEIIGKLEARLAALESK